MPEKSSPAEFDELEARVESLERQLDEQSAQLRLLWGTILFGAAIVILLGFFPPSVVVFLVLLFVVLFGLRWVR